MTSTDNSLTRRIEETEELTISRSRYKLFSNSRAPAWNLNVCGMRLSFDKKRDALAAKKIAELVGKEKIFEFRAKIWLDYQSGEFLYERKITYYGDGQFLVWCDNEYMECDFYFTPSQLIEKMAAFDEKNIKG